MTMDAQQRSEFVDAYTRVLITTWSNEEFAARLDQDLLGALAPSERKETAVVRDKYLKEVERYQSDKEDISEKAKELEKERDLISRRADRFDGGEGLLEVGLVICSITLLTKRRGFWFSGIFVGALGVLMALTGLFLH